MDIIKVTPPASQNAYGERSYGQSVSYAGRYFKRERVVYEGTSREYTSPATVYVDPDGADIVTSSQVILPNDPRTYTVQEVYIARDETGAVHHVKITLI